MIRISPICSVLLAACSSASPAGPGRVPTRLLTDAEFQATSASPMREVASADDTEVNIWPYVDAVPAADLQGFAIVDGMVAHVYRAAGDAYDHVLLPSETANVFLAIVVDLKSRRVLGHHLLNLNEKYGLPDPGRADKAW